VPESFTRPESFTNLTCPNCGGKLEVGDDRERFACGYCGREVAVEWRGGTVALKAITDSIQQLRTGAERTAAELALVRLQRELTDLEDRLSGLRGTAARLASAPPPSEEPQGWPWISSTILLVFAAATFFLSLASYGVANTFLGILVVTFLAAALSAAGKRGQRKQREALERLTSSKLALDAEIETVKHDITDRERQISYQKGIVSVPNSGKADAGRVVAPR
jgi:ribosomal protein S27AE